MRPRTLVAAALALVATGAVAGLERREPASEVARVLAGVRAPSAGARPTAPARRRLYVVVSALTPARRAALEEAGLVIELPRPGAPAPPWRAGEVVQGVVSAAGEAAIRGLPFVVAIEVPGEVWQNAGAATTAGDAVLFGAAARALLGTAGEGVTVGVISAGLDHLAAAIASGDLPPDVALASIPGRGAGRGDEGTAMLEIVHDLAPGARLLFAAPETSAEMVAAIDGLAAAGAQVIVDDLVFTDEPKFEDGPIAAAARRFAGGGGLYVTAAGNFARTHYLATYRPGGGRVFADTPYRAVHRFAGDDFGNSLRIPPGVEVLAVLQWTEPFGRAGDDLDLVLARRGAGGDVALAAGRAEQAGRGDPIEALRYTNRSAAPVEAYLAVAEFARASPAARLRLNLVVFSRASLDQQYVVRRESVFGHAAVEEVVSVAAADAGQPDVLEDFSSEGPATIVFPSRAVRQVPRLTAVDAVETTVGRLGVFANPFRGTSAAAPHAAGCAALLLAAGVPAATARAAMEATALDLLAPGFDLRSGAGRVDCGAAARLVSGQGTAPGVGGVSARFDPSAAVVVEVRGDDADGDVRSVGVRLIDRGGAEVAREATRVTASGAEFAAAVALRGAPLARARAVAARATDAVGLDSGETVVALGCPGDASLGDALCVAGDLLDWLADVPGVPGRRLVGAGRATVAALARAGAASAAGQRRAARRRLAAALARARRVLRLARAAAAGPEEGPRGLVDDARALVGRLRALRLAPRPSTTLARTGSSPRS